MFLCFFEIFLVVGLVLGCIILLPPQTYLATPRPVTRNISSLTEANIRGYTYSKSTASYIISIFFHIKLTTLR